MAFTLRISSEDKKQTFTNIITAIETASDIICFRIFCQGTQSPNYVHIQGMDSAHVCLYDCQLPAAWFDEFSAVPNTTPLMMTGGMCRVQEDGDETESKDTPELNVSFSTKDFKKALKVMKPYHIMEMIVNNSSKEEFFNLRFKLKETQVVEHDLELPLKDYENVLVNIETEHCCEVDFSVDATKICDDIKHLAGWGDTICFEFNERGITMLSEGDSGKATVFISVEDLTNYALDTDANLNMAYSVLYLQKMCLHSRISNEIHIRMGTSIPMRLSYQIDTDCHFHWFMAAKIIDDL